MNSKIILPKENEKYDNYIQRILESRENIKDENDYQEVHHIIPKCMGGTNDKDNLIHLYALEHYYAHKLLAYENPENEKLQIAYWAMSGLLNGFNHRKYTLTEIELADARERMAKSKIGKKRSAETIRKMSEHHANVSGEKNPMYGKHHTKEVLQRLHEVNIGKTLSQETKDKISKSEQGRILSEETKKKISENHWDCSMGKHPKANKVICNETQEIFSCAKEAGIWAGLKGKNPGTSIIAQIRNPEKKKYAGHHPVTNEPLTWQYYIE